MKRILLVDMLGSCFVRFHMKDHGLVKNFVVDLQRIMSAARVDRCILLREGGSGYRNNLLPTYKAARKERREKYTPAEKREYEKFLKEVDRTVSTLQLLGVPNLQLIGAEADDLAGYLCASLPPDTHQILLLSEDSDWSQLLCRKNTVQASYKAMLKAQAWGGGQWISYNRYVKEKGITPEQAFEIKQLTGDKSDSIPGVDGVGDTGATRLIEKYGSLQGVLDNRHQLDIPRLSTKAKEAFLTCDATLDLGYKLMNLRWRQDEWGDILSPSVQWTKDLTEKLHGAPSAKLGEFKELCYENGWLDLLEDEFLDYFSVPWK